MFDGHKLKVSVGGDTTEIDRGQTGQVGNLLITVGSFETSYGECDGFPSAAGAGFAAPGASP